MADCVVPQERENGKGEVMFGRDVTVRYTLVGPLQCWECHGAVRCGAAKTDHVRCCRNRSRAVLPKPITCSVAETDHVRCCRNRSCAVLPKRTRFVPEGSI
jgi:hypothetical protein